jgi:hypothetical protein
VFTEVFYYFLLLRNSLCEIPRNGQGHGIKMSNSEVLLKNQPETEAQAIFLNPFTVCSWCKLKFVVCPFVGESNGNRPFADGLNGLPNRIYGYRDGCRPLLGSRYCHPVSECSGISQQYNAFKLGNCHFPVNFHGAQEALVSYCVLGFWLSCQGFIRNSSLVLSAV